ncbi:PQQ-dependent sugar dehydrogenase [Streptosporangiaceae bacterium NEAU-GS5]|nr:PQQ-dependent sugar dehydrogenase [Streptosporangiaceae bacterium NEAU-GS5]
MRAILTFLSALLLPLACLVVVPVASAAAGVPAEFDKTLVADGLDQPTAFRFLPDGRILIAEKNGAIRLIKNGVLQEEPVVTVPTANADERGLLGIEIDPDFSANGWIYAAYTHSDDFDRLSRFTMTGDTISLSSEVVLLKSNQQANIFHHGGEVRFGQDGKLYWSLGMNTYNPNSQNLGTLHGKILRINKDGGIPPDNPFVGTPGVEPAIWAYGVRNTFRFDVIPDGPNAGKILGADVGGSKWEELNVIERGGNYGWVTTEGVCDGCGFINPVFTYPHTDPPAAAGSMTAVAVYTGNAFPAEFDHAVFFADYTLHFIKWLKMDDEFQSVISVNDFDLDAGTPVQLSVGPDGDLYQLNIFPGALYKIGPSGGDRAPVAKASATPADGLAPLSVAFSSEGTADPDPGTNLTYAWDFKDGSTSTDPNPTHVFTTDGTYEVSLTVSDGVKTSVATRRVTVGNRHPTGTITSPQDQSKYSAGDEISYSATATDPEDGTLPAGAYSWSVVFHHADHIHPFLGPINGVTHGTFTIPRVADNIDTTWYEIKLTVTDAGGLSHTSSVAIKPNLVTLTFTSNPLGPTYTVDGLPFTGTKVEQAVVGVERTLSSPTTQFYNGAQFAFDNWSDGGEQTHVIRTPATPTTYQVNLLELVQPPAPWQSKDIGARTVAGTTFYDNGSFTLKGGGNDIWDATDEFRYVYQPLNGDGTIIAKVSSQQNTNPWAKAGVMIKEAASGSAKYAAVALTPENGMHFQYDFNGDGGGYASSTGWMKLTRVGDLFTAYRSPDGIAWTSIGSTTLAMQADVTVGLFVCSHDMTALGQAVFDAVSVTQGSTVGPPPAPWSLAAVGTTGSATYDASNGAFTVNGGGHDVWDTTQEFAFLRRPMAGDGSITARVTAQTPTSDWAKAGVMVRSGTAFADMLITPEHGAHFQTSAPSDAAAGDVAWVRLVRTGDVVTGYASPDGTAWTQIGQFSGFTGQVDAGMFVTAHSGSGVGSATFDHVTFDAPDDPGLPAGWTGGDVGTPTTPGSHSELAGTWTVTGAGDDVWGTVDQFHFVHRTLTGDGTLVAHLTGQTRVEGWTKAGIMFKASAASGSAYAAVLHASDHGTHLQATSEQDVEGGDLPWLKLVRAGDTFTAYGSADGAAWIRIGARTVTMPAAAEVGLWVTSHDGSLTSTATFTDVSVTPAGSSSLPDGWSHADIGSPALAGTATVSGTAFTVTGAGGDIWGATDQFHYAYRALDGDGSLVARVVSQENTDGWAKSGVMIKSAATPGSPYAAVFLTPAHGVVQQAGFSSSVDGGDATAPVWLRITRTGSSITTYRSADGATWTAVGTATLSGPATIGLFVCSHEAGQLNTTVFDGVTVSP